ncbi:RNA polymerase sigma-70 factor (ECF subfamily) [Dyadobacter jejuensis]|uniref:RNA polymerase sigma-70 factor (ECF subfamily) n=1 Tax=Dyadobacter jejuensis TaxID=1082580 RepID=A0A316AC90_9BACT|nr:sigma-70 family RNA polymerase sigma factor [Dyadobacter jejuensis]PWJ54504.1 RNA polymerase sigma-70 factor (ECF subfamily) [Dyadobacter jejuensis]
MSDEELLALFENPETRSNAFNHLVRKYQQKVYWLIRKMVVDHDDANDLTQEVFIKTWKALDKFRGDSKLYTWLYRVASNEAINFLNKKKRRFFIPLHDVENELSEKLESDPELSGDAIQLKLQKALLKLPEKQRLVFNLKYYEELPYDEIAEITGTSVGALKASYHWATKKIEDYLNDTD